MRNELKTTGGEGGILNRCHRKSLSLRHVDNKANIFLLLNAVYYVSIVSTEPSSTLQKQTPNRHQMLWIHSGFTFEGSLCCRSGVPLPMPERPISQSGDSIGCERRV